MKKNFTYIDLFAGCGGLSLGLEKSGFELVLAVEKSPMAAETYYHNFINRLTTSHEWHDYCKKSIEEQYRNKLIVDELSKVLSNNYIIKSLKKIDVDLVAGGPPCQGFSIAGRRNPADQRNQLPWQFLEFIELVNPKVVIMENVVGMRQSFKNHNVKSTFDEVQEALAKMGKGYIVQPLQLNAMHFGVPQHRPRVILIALRKDIAKKTRITSSNELWKSDYEFITTKQIHRPDLAPRASFSDNNFRTVQNAFWDLNEKNYKYDLNSTLYKKTNGRYAYNIRTDSDWMPSIIKTKLNGSRKLLNHNLRKHGDRTIQRFRLYQYLGSQNIPSKILNIPAKEKDIDLIVKTLYKFLKKSDMPAASPDDSIIAKDISSLIDLIVDLQTKKHSQRPLRLDAPSPTIVSLADDFIHPIQPRTLTVREMARIQSFPDLFEFRSKETTGSHRRRIEVPQYTQVGNAVAPLLAHNIGNHVVNILRSL